MRFAIIPARGGSKRIPRKNVRDFLGKPMLAYSIELARDSGLFESVIVSTDDAEIADVAVRWGAEVPFVRPMELANDHAGTTEVLQHAVGFLRREGRDPASICCLYPAAPLTTVATLVRACATLEEKGWDFVFPAVRFGAPIHRSFRQADDGSVEMFFPEHFKARSQDLPVAWRDAGQLYWGTADAWAGGRTIFGSHSTFVEVPRWEAQDIDDEEDWYMAEVLAKGIATAKRGDSKDMR